MILFAFILFAVLIAAWLLAPSGAEKAPAKADAVAARLQMGEAGA